MEVVMIVEGLVLAIAVTIVVMLHLQSQKEMKATQAKADKAVAEAIAMGKAIEDAHNSMAEKLSEHNVKLAEVSQMAQFLKARR